ncbi:uncharacterized protein [Salmo salar]|uniref:P-type domain-containing protein n=1 Tax=Salmo salar TaxID=8030 RepID=A0ABM3DXB6_SALSA|nr:uncharacterized protein LOC123730511 [Salmo salar]
MSILTPTLPPQPSLSPGLSPRPSLRCLAGQMMVSLPSALLDSIQVKDQLNGWVSISSAPAACRYILQMSKGGGVILHSPLPACHSQAMALNPHQLSLPLKFWDTVLGQYRTLELHCPSTVTPSPHTTTTTHTRPPTPPKPHVFCSARHMRVELPPGPISGIVVKDIEGNEMSLMDAPKHCGYVASKGKDGMITLNRPFNSCHMTVQGKEHRMDVIYSTLNGQKGKAQLSCPVSIPVSHQECNLPSDQRLPCGRRPLSQAECLSLGCCYSTKPSACYYSMDGGRPNGNLHGGDHQHGPVNHPRLWDHHQRLSYQAAGRVPVHSWLCDVQYSSFYPQYHRPLQMLLGKPLHLEVRLLNPPQMTKWSCWYTTAWPTPDQDRLSGYSSIMDVLTIWTRPLRSLTHLLHPHPSTKARYEGSPSPPSSSSPLDRPRHWRTMKRSTSCVLLKSVRRWTAACV